MSVVPLSSFITEKGYRREYFKWFSPHLQRDMELLVFGFAGKPVIFFPTRTARFYDYEDWKVIDAFKEKLIGGELQIYCVDSADQQSFYNKAITPAERIQKHYQFENYILLELMPFIKQKNNNPYLISAGCSLGGYHAVNLAFRYPQLFSKVVAMSGRYDLTLKLKFFDDLFDGYIDNHIYSHTPIKFIPNIQNPHSLDLLRKLDITLVIGEEDAFLENNKQMHEVLLQKQIPHHFYIWKGEAHKAQYWIQMVQLYF
ncbi:esterase family protein [Parasediminibacterium sp. JCM 36343]|uniref:esterase family protein n=1 Tax=Parasediminibacterium sp. JCM 36343 TaxID=3374279 RepID=UPI003978EBC5